MNIGAEYPRKVPRLENYLNKESKDCPMFKKEASIKIFVYVILIILVISSFAYALGQSEIPDIDCTKLKLEECTKHSECKLEYTSPSWWQLCGKLDCTNVQQQQSGTIRIARVDQTGTAQAPVATSAWVDNANPLTANPADFPNLAVGTHTAYVTNVPGYTVTAGICARPIGSSGCTVTDFSTTPVVCTSTNCSVSINALSSATTILNKVVFKFTPVALPPPPQNTGFVGFEVTVGMMTYIKRIPIKIKYTHPGPDGSGVVTEDVTVLTGGNAIPKQPFGKYTVTYISGRPPGAKFLGVGCGGRGPKEGAADTCTNTLSEIHPGIIFDFNFSPAPEDQK